MKRNMPQTPFSTRLSGSAKETELRIRSIFQWKKKRPPVIVLIAAVLVVVLCGSLIGFTSTAQNGLLGQVYQEYFERNPAERITIAYENKEAVGYPLLTAQDSSFEAALQYIQVMELRTVRGKDRYIGDFDSRDGAIILNGAGGQRLKIEMYPSAECLVISEGEAAKVYRWNEWAEAFDLEQFLHLWEIKEEDEPKGNIETPPEPTPLAMRSVLKNLSWENTYGLATGGAADHEMAMTAESMELFASVADHLIPVDEPSEFKTILGGVTLWLSQDKSERVNFYPGENYPHVLVNYVTDMVKEYASVEDAALYTFLVAAVEKKYVELHDLDGDGSFEIIQWDSKNNRRSLVIFDVYGGQIQRIDANEALGGVAATDYSGQIGNIRSEYNNLIMAVTDGANILYRYNNGQFTYVCTLEEALNTEDRVHPLTANSEVLAHIDRFFEKNVSLQAFLLSGSGPLTSALEGYPSAGQAVVATMDEYRSEVQEILGGYNWIKHEEKPASPRLTSADWILRLSADGAMMQLNTNSNCLTVREKTVKGTEEHYYTYDGEPGELNMALAAISDTPLFYYGLTMLPASVGTGETLAIAYEQKFKELFLASGIIADYESVSLEYVSENGFEYIDLTYKVTPVHPDKFWCSSIEIDEAGRWTIREGVILSKVSIAGEDKVWWLYGFANEDMEWMKDHLKQLAQASQT